MKHLFLIGILSSLFLGGNAQQVALYFSQMPAELLPGVSIDTRKDLVDFCKNGKPAVMPATFGGKVELKVLSDDYLLLQTSENADVQIKMLQMDSLRMLAVVRSAAAPLRDSRLRFYDTSWKPLNGIAAPQFTLADFTDTAQADALRLSDRLNELGPRLFVSLTFRSGDNALKATSSLKEDMGTAQRETLGAVVRDSVMCEWTGHSFQKR